MKILKWIPVLLIPVLLFSACAEEEEITPFLEMYELKKNDDDLTAVDLPHNVIKISIPKEQEAAKTLMESVDDIKVISVPANDNNPNQLAKKEELMQDFESLINSDENNYEIIDQLPLPDLTVTLAGEKEGEFIKELLAGVYMKDQMHIIRLKGNELTKDKISDFLTETDFSSFEEMMKEYNE